MADATLTFNAFDAIKVPFDPARLAVWVEFNTPNGRVTDADGRARIGAGVATVDSNGLVTIPNVPVPSVDSNPTNFQVKVCYDAPARAAGSRTADRERGDFGWMTVTGDDDVLQLEAEYFMDPTYEGRRGEKGDTGAQGPPGPAGAPGVGSELGYAERTSSFTTTNTSLWSTAAASVVGSLSVTVTGTGRPVDVEFYCPAMGHTAGAIVTSYLIVNGATNDARSQYKNWAINFGEGGEMKRRLVLANGTSYTFTVGISANAAGTSTVTGSTSAPTHLAVTQR